jgi:hypothetical protein
MEAAITFFGMGLTTPWLRGTKEGAINDKNIDGEMSELYKYDIMTHSFL